MYTQESHLQMEILEKKRLKEQRQQIIAAYNLFVLDIH